MTKSTKIVFTALGAAFLAVFLICYFIFVVDSGDAPENTLTIDQQTPRVESLQTKRDGLKETPAQPEQEDASASEDAVQSVPFDNSGSADNRSGVQSDAPQVEAQDSFTAEFQEAADEYIEFGKKLVEAFPHYPVAHTKNKNYSQLFAHLKEYNEELSRQNLSREDRVAKLNARLINFGRKLARASHTDAGPLATSYTPEERAAIKTQYFDYIDENAPAKLFTLLGVERRSHWRRAPWMQPIP